MVVNPNLNSPIQSFHEFSSDFTKPLFSQIHCNTYRQTLLAAMTQGISSRFGRCSPICSHSWATSSNDSLLSTAKTSRKAWAVEMDRRRIAGNSRLPAVSRISTCTDNQRQSAYVRHMVIPAGTKFGHNKPETLWCRTAKVSISPGPESVPRRNRRTDRQTDGQTELRKLLRV